MIGGAADHTLPSIGESLRLAAARLRASSETPRLDAELLLAHLLEVSRAALIVRSGEPLGGGLPGRFDALLARRAASAPLAYLTGTREFWSLPLAVTPDVLVPRPETELLVEHALAVLPRGADRAVLDLGTGSGAIAVALAAERPRARVIGVDLSAAALAVAAANARALGLERVAWRAGSWYQAVPAERFDLVVSNPPYVAAGDAALARLAAEPALALTPGATGLEALAALVADAPGHLHPGGWLMLEHGSLQGPDVAALLARRGFIRVSTIADHAGLPRVTLGQLPPSTQDIS